MNLSISALSMPIRLRPETPMSDEEFMAFSDENRPYRMEREPNGEILVMTPTGSKTDLLNGRIFEALSVWARDDGRGVAFGPSGGFTLPNGAVRSPDAAWVSNRNWNALSEVQQEGFAPLCPEFVIELFSPSDRIKDARAKMADEWIANGAELAWLIEPKARRVTVYRPGQEAEVYEDPTSVQGIGCVAGFELVMERVWGLAEGR
jgi:Uma2 family endonuclease